MVKFLCIFLHQETSKQQTSVADHSAISSVNVPSVFNLKDIVFPGQPRDLVGPHYKIYHNYLEESLNIFLLNQNSLGLFKVTHEENAVTHRKKQSNS